MTSFSFTAPGSLAVTGTTPVEHAQMKFVPEEDELVDELEVALASSIDQEDSGEAGDDDDEPDFPSASTSIDEPQSFIGAQDDVVD